MGLFNFKPKTVKQESKAVFGNGPKKNPVRVKQSYWGSSKVPKVPVWKQRNDDDRIGQLKEDISRMKEELKVGPSEREVAEERMDRFARALARVAEKDKGDD